jgi:hypothetical protein
VAEIGSWLGVCGKTIQRRLAELEAARVIHSAMSEFTHTDPGCEPLPLGVVEAKPGAVRIFGIADGDGVGRIGDLDAVDAATAAAALAPGGGVRVVCAGQAGLS